MEFTTYGKNLAKSEALPTPNPLGGATAHAEACGYDAGNRIVLTGTDAYGMKFRREAQSLYGAFMQAQAAWGIERGWHVQDDGTRRLVFKR